MGIPSSVSYRSPRSRGKAGVEGAKGSHETLYSFGFRV